MFLKEFSMSEISNISPASTGPSTMDYVCTANFIREHISEWNFIPEPIRNFQDEAVLNAIVSALTGNIPILSSEIADIVSDIKEGVGAAIEDACRAPAPSSNP
jgi:hypothetical protein